MLSMGSSVWNADTNLQVVEGWKSGHSCRRDDAVGSYRYKTSACTSGYRIRLVSAADNANGDGTSGS
jgi:hypothetical protein